MCVCELKFIVGIKQPSVSRHLKKMKDAEIICFRPDKRWNEYYINRNANEYRRIVMGNLSGWLN